jgi:hypothetical protein
MEFQMGCAPDNQIRAHSDAVKNSPITAEYAENIWFNGPDDPEI